MSRIHSLRLRQRLLRLELRDAKRRLMVPDSRWDYNRKYRFYRFFAIQITDILFVALKENLKKSFIFKMT